MEACFVSLKDPLNLHDSFLFNVFKFVLMLKQGGRINTIYLLSKPQFTLFSQSTQVSDILQHKTFYTILFTHTIKGIPPDVFKGVKFKATRSHQDPQVL